jgi:hypothetical protein
MGVLFWARVIKAARDYGVAVRRKQDKRSPEEKGTPDVAPAAPLTVEPLLRRHQPKHRPRPGPPADLTGFEESLWQPPIRQNI